MGFEICTHTTVLQIFNTTLIGRYPGWPHTLRGITTIKMHNFKIKMRNKVNGLPIVIENSILQRNPQDIKIEVKVMIGHLTYKNVT